MNVDNFHIYQHMCVEHGLNNKFAGLFLDMGLGKTVITLTIAEILMYKELEIKKCLIVAPKRVAETVWQEEAEKWDHLKHLRFSKIIGNEKQRIEALNAKADVYIVSRDNVAWLCGIYGGLKIPFEMLILDELSSFKNYNAQRFKALKRIRPSVKRVIGLTGTPAPNGLIDLWSQLYLIDMGERLEKTVSRYRNLYFRPGQTNGHVVYSYRPLDFSEQTIYEKIKDICISMKAFDYIQMPVRTDNFISVKLNEKNQELYNKFEKESVLQIFGNVDKDDITIVAVNAAALSNKLLQCANGAVYDENRNVHEVHDQKLDVLEELIDTSNRQNILIAWNFQHDRDRIMKRLSRFSPRELKTDKDIQDWNEGKIQIMLAHPASAGHGLNLQYGGSIIIWFSVNWSLELYQQFNSRIYRQGQQEHVIIHHLIAEHTHDEDVMKAIKSKDKKQETLIQAVKAKIMNYLG